MVDLTAERLSLALAAARLGDFRWDAGTDVVKFSARAAELAGASERLLSRQQVRELIHPEDRDLVTSAVNRAILEHDGYSITHRFLRPGGERIVKASGRAIFDEHGQLSGIVGVLQDITSDRFLMQLDDAVRPLVDPEQITYTAASLLGEYLGVDRCAYCFVEPDEDTFILTGNYTRGADSIVGTYRFRQFGAECLRLMRAGQPYVVQDSNTDRRIDEEDRKAYVLTAICGVICVPILKSGRFAAAMAVHTVRPRSWPADEVELVQQVASRCWESIERARVERERQGLLEAAQAANRTKDEFLAMLGHELRNPLAPINTALELMKLKDPRAFERERTVIQRQTQHLTTLVDDLLDVARIARGVVELKPELVELSDVVLAALEVAAPLLTQRNHTLHVEVPKTGLLVHADRARLVQVVVNLLSNAAKYTPAAGRITVRGFREQGDIVLSVRDTGIGMSHLTLEHVFESFFQARQGVERAQGGLGLGLSIVRSLVQRHGGTVEAHSAGLNQGSELVVRLPLAPATSAIASAEVRASAATPGDWKEKRVLVVDDNQDAATLLAEALKLRGCRVRVAYDGADALRVASEHAFDLALLDIGLPTMDGYELAGRLRRLGHWAAASLIAVTGYGQESDAKKALDSGFHHHLVKPIDLQALDSIVAGKFQDTAAIESRR